jgi:hypothetical protein
MRRWQIILLTVVFLGATGPLRGQLFAPTGPTVVSPPSPATPPGTPVVVTGPPYLQPTQVIQPAQQVMPVYPPPSAVQLPTQTPGTIFGPPGAPVAPPAGSIVVPQAPGAVEQLPAPPGVAPMMVPQPGTVMPPGTVPIAAPGPPNPISVPVVDDDLAWDQITDVVSDFFTIAHEQRARRGSEGWCEGRIDTVPLDGATILQPFRHDSVGSFNRWESTFQSIRRCATVRVMPDANGYLVEVIVEKQLEDLPRPEKSTAGAATFPTNITLPSPRLEDVSRIRQSPRWLSLGRDPALEQLMLAEIHARLNGITRSGVSVFQP